MNNIKKFLFKSTTGVIKEGIARVSTMTELCRSFMYVPGDKERMIAKIVSLKASSAPDIITFDCEDSVAFTNKALARDNIFKCIKSGTLAKCAHSTICIRGNGVTNQTVALDDISLISECLKSSNYQLPQMVNIPKFESESGMLWFDNELKSKIEVGKLLHPLKLSIIIENVQSLIKFKEILQYFKTQKLSCFQLSNIIFGSDDYCASMGTSRSPSNDEVLYARQYVANIAAAYQIPAIDMVETDLNDMNYFEKNCLFGARIGFVGKQVIHPKQLDIVHSAFSPTLEKISWASELLKEFQRNKDAGHGTFVFKGNMIDLPTVLQADRIVKLSSLIKKKG